MRKPELIERIAKETGIPKKHVNAVINSFVNQVTGVLKEQEQLQLLGFGTFKVAERAAHDARNPVNGTVIHVPAKLVPKFAFSKNIKDALNEEE